MSTSQTGLLVGAVAAGTALVVGMGLADNGAARVVAAKSERQVPRAIVQEKVREGAERRDREAPRGDEAPGKPGEPENEAITGPAAQQVDQRAYPRGYVTAKRARVARKAYANLPQTLTRSDFGKGVKNRSQKAAVDADWQALGPVEPVVPSEVTYTGKATTTSGRVTAMAIAPTCDVNECRLWVAAAGGGIWRTDNALADVPDWTPLDNGLTTNTFGSIVLDPVDPDTVYAGSGEPSGSSDSEAGVGLFKSTDGGDTWTLVPGSPEVAKDRSIAAILIDPNDTSVIRIGTALARHGASSVNGGRRTPPDAPEMGIYKSTDGGDSFSLEFSEPGDGVPPSTGQDYFTGGVRRLMYDPNDAGQIYASIMGYGIYREGNPNDTDPATFNQVYRGEFAVDNFPGNEVDPYGAMIDFDLADVSGKTRIYVGDTNGDFYAKLIVADAVGDTGDQGLLDAQETPPAPPVWEMRSSEDITDVGGYSSNYWCQNGQCSYDSFVKVEPGNPDTVWMGGAMNYDEIWGTPLSNGRAVIRSTDGGHSFQDMTNDSQSPPLGMHPDQHALVFNPSNGDQVFVGSDGGVVRTNGTYVAGDDCASRQLNTDQTAFCQSVLSSIPEQIDSLNVGLNTLQFQSLSASATEPYTDVIGGTQDNGTWAWNGASDWFESVGGDGGQSAISPGAGSRMHTYYGTSGDVNFNGNDPTGWNYVTGPIDNSGEQSSFYVPLITDPVSPGTYFMGAQSVWRTQDSGGDPAQLEAQCNEMTGTGPWDTCGDFERIGYTLAPSADDYIVALSRAQSDAGTMWIGLRYGELFITNNADAPRAKVAYDQMDTGNLPGRFVSGIAVDPDDPNHAWISYSGYGAYTPGEPGHVFEAWWDPATAAATFEDRSLDLGDQPVTGIALDSMTGDVYASTDFGVARLVPGATSWAKSAGGLPPVATYGLTMDPQARVLYAATHGRGAYGLPLNPVAVISGPTQSEVGSPVQFDSAPSAGYKGIASVQWTFPDGTSSTDPVAQWTPTTIGDHMIRLTVTDSLGHSSTSSTMITAVAKPSGALVPQFADTADANRTATSVTLKITNYNPNFAWEATSTKGSAKVTSKGNLKVTDLTPGQKTTATVTTTRADYDPGTASVTLKASKMCPLTVKAKGKKYKLPANTASTLVRKANSSKCKVGAAKVDAGPMGKKGTSVIGVKKSSKGRVTVETAGKRVNVTVTFTAKPKSDAYAAQTWTRTWKSRK